MPAITRRQCKCACPDGRDPPDGEGLPECSCSACPGSPCSLYVDFGCTVECDGLRGGGHLAIDSGLLKGKRVTELIKDCLFLDDCRYVLNRFRQDSDCTDADCGALHACLPTACDECGYVYENCRETPYWGLTYATSTATLTGTTDSGDEIVYTTDDWVCPEAGVLSVNQLWITEYPDTLAGDGGEGDCKKFPKSVCIYPGTYGYENPCSDPNDACSCCDNGADEACFSITSASCGISALAITTTRNATLPGGVSDPSGACGYFWGSAAYSCDVSFSIGLLVWCDGTDWHASMYCDPGEGYGWTLICTTVATLTRCCPNFEITFDCEGEDFGACCCEEGGGTVEKCGCDVPATLTATVDYAACADVDGLAVEMTYNAGTSSWEGTVSAGACGDLDFILSLTTSGEDCIIAFQINGAEPGCAANTLLEPLDCPFVGFDITATWDNSKCPCCPLGSFTVNITP